MRLPALLALLVCAATAAAPCPASGGAGDAPNLPAAAAAPLPHDEGNRRYFTDLPVVTHEGNEARFYSDLLKDKTVLIHFFYLRCATVCPPAFSRLTEVQKLLGERLGKDIRLISLNVDPDNDTPEAIKYYAKVFEPRPGWLFVTGEKEDITAINRKLGNIHPEPESHLTVFLIGNLKTGHWVKMLPSAAPAKITETILSVAGEKQ